MSKNRKGFIHYCRVSVNDGLNTDLSTSDLLLDKFDKEIFQNCCFCYCTIEIKKDFTRKKNVCDYCMALLENEGQINPRIHIIWTENQKYRVFSKFYHAFLDCIFKCGKINNETIDKYINAHINYYFI